MAPLRRSHLAALHVLGTVLLWSFVPVVVKTLQPHALAVSLGRLVFAVAALVALQYARRRRPVTFHGPWKPLFIGGVAMAGNYCLFNIGLKYTTASAANLVVQNEAIVLVLLARWVLKERWTPTKAVGIGVCIAGILVVAWNGRPLQELLRAQDLKGNLLVFTAGCCWGVYAVSQRLLARRNGNLDSLIALFMVSTAVTASVVAVVGPGGPLPVPLRVILWSVVLGAFGTGAAYALLSRGIALSDATTAGMMTTSLPLFTALEASLFLGERPSGWLLAGGALIIGGLLLVAREEPPVEKEAAREVPVG